MLSWRGLGGRGPPRNLRYPCLAPRISYAYEIRTRTRRKVNVNVDDVVVIKVDVESTSDFELVLLRRRNALTKNKQ